MLYLIISIILLIWLTLNTPDLANSQQFKDYVLTRSELYPLRFLQASVKSELRLKNRLAITSVQPGDRAFVDLRFYDGSKSSYFDAFTRNTPFMGKAIKR